MASGGKDPDPDLEPGIASGSKAKPKTKTKTKTETKTKGSFRARISGIFSRSSRAAGGKDVVGKNEDGKHEAGKNEDGKNEAGRGSEKVVGGGIDRSGDDGVEVVAKDLEAGTPKTKEPVDDDGSVPTAADAGSVSVTAVPDEPVHDQPVVVAVGGDGEGLDGSAKDSNPSDPIPPLSSKLPEGDADAVPEKSASELVLRPISEVWDEAYEELYAKDKSLITNYEKYISKSIGSAVVFSGLGRVHRQQQMKIVLEKKIEEIENSSWKLRFRNHELAVKDLVEPVVGVIDWAKDYVGGAVEASPPAAAAWAGVCLLLPLILNPSAQAAARTKGLDEVASILRQCSVREVLYSRRYGAGGSNQFGKESVSSHAGYRDSLRNLYVQILTFQATSFCFLSKNFFVRTSSEMVKWNDWENLLAEVKKEELSLKSFEELWRDLKFEEKWELIRTQHQQKLEKMNAVEKEVTRVSKVITDVQKNEEREKLLKWLSSVDPSTNYNSARQAHESTTGDWLISGDDEFQRWKDTPNSFIWLHGQAGAGKSFLSSSVIHHLRKSSGPNPHFALAYFYFSFRDREKQSCANMLRSMIVQLCGRRPDTPQPLLDLKRYHDVSQNPDLESLEETLKAATEDFETIYLVVDALDECPKLEDERTRLLEILQRILAWGLPSLHILVTSRREPDIDSFMGELLALSHVSSIDLQTHRKEVDRDMGVFIDQKFMASDFTSWPPDVKEDARLSLITKSGGMFQYVALQLDALKGAQSLDAIKGALENLPSGLDETYDRMLLSIPPNQREQSIRALTWLAFCTRPLALEELAEAVVIDLKATPVFSPLRRLFKSIDVLGPISGLFSIQPPPRDGEPYHNEDTVEFSHFSAKEYLLSDRIQTSPASIYYLGENYCNLEIGESCWQYFEHIARLELSDEGLNYSRVLEDDFPLYWYCIDDWAEHIERVPRSAWRPLIAQMALAILQPSDNIFQAWRSRSGGTDCPLSYTARKGYLQLSKLLLEDGEEDINKICSQYGTALNAACIAGQQNSIQFLIESGADPYLSTEHSKCALDAALTKYSSEAVVTQLLELPEVFQRCERVNFWPQVKAMYPDSGGGRMLEVILKHGADPNGHEKGRRSALNLAVTVGNRATGRHSVRLLLEYGADPLLRFGHWKNCVQAAVGDGWAKGITPSIPVVKQLLLHGAVIDPPDEKWADLIRKTGADSHQGQSLTALQNICGERSRSGGFTEEDIDAYMQELQKAITKIDSSEATFETQMRYNPTYNQRSSLWDRYPGARNGGQPEFRISGQKSLAHKE